MMSVGARLLLFWAGSAVVIGVALLIWGWRSGQFRNIEEAKYRMLEDREPEPWPGRDDGGRETESGETTEEEQDEERG
jgi:nitrogen fixation-related uncharacterized protein